MGLTELEALARWASQARWWHARADVVDRDDAVAFVRESLEQSESHELYMICVGTEGQPDFRAVAYTGNGPTSEDNARYIAALHPTNVRALVAEIRRLREELRRSTTDIPEGDNIETPPY